LLKPFGHSTPTLQTDRQTDFLWHRPDLSVGQKLKLRQTQQEKKDTIMLPCRAAVQSTSTSKHVQFF